MDDEYFRMMLVLREGVDSEEARTLRRRVFEQLRQPKKWRFRQAVLRNIRPVEIRTRSGLFGGTRLSYNVEGERLSRVAERIVKGLFFHEFQRPLPEGFGVKAWEASMLLDQMSAETLEDTRQITIPLLAQPVHTVGKIFTYRYIVAEDGPNMTAWWFAFYDDAIFFVAITSLGEDAFV